MPAWSIVAEAVSPFSIVGVLKESSFAIALWGSESSLTHVIVSPDRDVDRLRMEGDVPHRHLVGGLLGLRCGGFAARRRWSDHRARRGRGDRCLIVGDRKRGGGQRARGEPAGDQDHPGLHVTDRSRFAAVDPPASAVSPPSPTRMWRAVGADLAQDPLQARLGGGVHVGHRRRDRGMDGGDPLVHRLGDGAVGGVALAARAQLDRCIASRALRSST